ncbi:hypothetical protein F5Y12DRAFT_787993 [Xylaria sp. FL1777]|nr:hypothetical protein F5Y12DRAFT_787993 [Xylaria sp. FL1777]
MPLIVPGITDKSGGLTQEWTNKLVGKTVSDDSHSETNFCKKDLPQQCRVIQPGMMVTKDFNPDRLNVHVKEDGTVSHLPEHHHTIDSYNNQLHLPRDGASKMFKKEIQAAPKSKLKSSVQRSLRQSLLTTYPLLHRYIDEILPKKGSLAAMKLPDRCTLYVLDGEPLFFQQDTATLLPHLKLVHRFPAAFPSIRIDRGAIRFVLSGATLMAPGLTSAGGRLPSGILTVRAEDGAGEGLDEEDRWTRELEKGEPVIVRAEGKSEACAVGFLVMGTKEVKDKGKGPVIEDAHYLGDGLWKVVTD